MKTLLYSAIIALMYSLCSCTPSGYLASEYGDEAGITMKMNRELKAELLAVTDTMIYVLKDKTIIAISNKNLKEINFKKYEDDYSWVMGVVLYEVLPSVLLTSLASGMDSQAGTTFAISIIPAVVTTTLFLFTSAKSSFYNFKDVSDVFELKKFSRYPGGITERQMQSLLNFYGQDGCIYLKMK